MKLCETCIYRNQDEYHKPCIVYRDDCEHYESEEDMSEVGVEIVKTEETEKNEIKYLNINVSNSEVERKPDIVRLCADAGILEYVKPSGDAISRQAVIERLKKEDKILYTTTGLNYLIRAIGELPSVNPQETKTGHWSRKTKVDAYDIAGVKTWGIKCQCDRCDFTTIVVEDFGYYKYCPNCGADMRGDTE